MQGKDVWLLAVLLGALALPGSQACAQHEAAGPAGARQQSVQASRYGTWLGLPRDGDKLYLPDDAYPRFPLPPGNEAYAHVDGLKMKEVVDQITAISRKSRDDGNQYWGRIPSTPYDRMTQDWVIDQFQKIGLKDVRRQDLEMKELWYPELWKAEFTISGKTTALKTTFPINETVGTPPAGISAQAVWVGLGTAADLIGREIKGKAVFIYSVPTPGGRDHSAAWNGAVRRVNEAGAALVFVVMGFPGNAISNPEGANGTRAPTLHHQSGRRQYDPRSTGKGRNGNGPCSGRHPGKTRNFKTANVWGVLPGATDENILVMAHTDAFFEGALDNASGIAMMLEIARHYAAIPQAQRRRTITFLTTPDHHHGSVGVTWVHDHFDFSKTAVIVNCEHPSQTLLYLLNGGIMTSNAVSARRWYVGGSDGLKSARD